MNNIITASGIVKTFGTGEEKRKILNGVSVEIVEGEFVSVMGPSGSGKSTLLYALSGMDRIDKGEVLFRSRDISRLDENEQARLLRKEMGFIFQQPTLLKNLNILDNIILPSTVDRKRDINRITEKALALMKTTGISGLENRGITQASGGQLQRAGICRALMNDPAIIFGDEPTGALNSTSASEIMDIFEELNSQGQTIMLVTHDAKVAARTNRVLFISDGKIVSEQRFDKSGNENLAERINIINKEMRKAEI